VGGPSGKGVEPAVTWGLLAAFVVHDLEELVTMPDSSAQLVKRLRARFPGVPDRVWEAVTQRHDVSGAPPVKTDS